MVEELEFKPLNERKSYFKLLKENSFHTKERLNKFIIRQFKIGQNTEIKSSK